MVQILTMEKLITVVNVTLLKQGEVVVFSFSKHSRMRAIVVPDGSKGQYEARAKRANIRVNMKLTM